MKLTDLKKVKIILLVMIVFLSYQRPVLAATDYTNVKIPVQQIFSSEAEGVSDEFSLCYDNESERGSYAGRKQRVAIFLDNEK